jgi:hypothetical protein
METGSFGNMVGIMYKIECSKTAINIDGKAMEGEDGKPLSLWNQIAIRASAIGFETSQKSGVAPVKLLDWCRTMASGGTLMLDKTDFASLQKFIEILPGTPILFIGQALEVFAEVEKTGEVKELATKVE